MDVHEHFGRVCDQHRSPPRLRKSMDVTVYQQSVRSHEIAMTSF